MPGGRKRDLIDQFADLIVGSSDPSGLAERTLGIVMSLVHGRAGAVFTRQKDSLKLFASRAIDQHVLDGVETVWKKHKDSLLDGQVFYSGDRESDRRLPKAPAGSPPGLVVLPVFADRKSEMLAVLYVDSHDPHFCDPLDLKRLGKFTRIVAKAVRDYEAGSPTSTASRQEVWETYLERTPSDEMQKEKLLLLLNRNEWNIARVARLMNVTRRTIYLRLARYGIPREKVRKTLPRKTARA